MAKASRKVVDAPRSDVFMLDPEQLVLVEDQASALYDERVKLPLREELVLNIMHYGVIEPVIVRKNPESGDFEVIDGRQRVKSAREANKRLKKSGSELLRVPCIFKRGEAHHLMGVMVSTFVREDDTPLGKSKKIARFLDLGRSEEEAAVAFGVSAATIKNLLALSDAPREVKAAVQSGKINASAGYKLSKLDPAEAKKRLKKLDAAAPRLENVKRPKKEVRKILSGGTAGEMRSRKDIEKRRVEIEESLWAGGEAKRILDAAFAWVLGKDNALDEFLMKADDVEAAAG